MSWLDIFLLLFGIAVGVLFYLSGRDNLYKLFLGLIIGFLVYALIESQVEITTLLDTSEYNSYQRFLANNAISILTLGLLLVPFLGLFFMLSPRIQIESYARVPSQLFMGLLLPIFLTGILAFLGSKSLLNESSIWRSIFDFFSSSGLYTLFQTLPWAIFALLMFLIFYKSLFILLLAFFAWLWNSIIKEFFKSWNEERERQKEERGEENHEG